MVGVERKKATLKVAFSIQFIENLAEQASSGSLGCFVLLVRNSKTNSLAGLDHLGANFHFLFVVPNCDSHSLQVRPNFAVGADVRV